MHFAVPSVPVVEEVVIPSEHHAYLTTVVPKGVLNEYSSSAHLDWPEALADCSLRIQPATSRFGASFKPEFSELAGIQMTDLDVSTGVGLRGGTSEIQSAHESVHLAAPLIIAQRPQSARLQPAGENKDRQYHRKLDVREAGGSGSLHCSRVDSIKQEVCDSRRQGTYEVGSRSVRTASAKAEAKPTSASKSSKGSWSSTTREQARKGSRQEQTLSAHDLEYDVVSR